MWLVAGLGNPGTKYEHTRHNIGFRVVDEFAREFNFPSFGPSKFGGVISEGKLGTTKVYLLKPMEFMNLSGFAVQRAGRFYGIAPANTLIVHDELDLEPGVTRVKLGGGHGGHNGLRSLLAQLGGAEFARIRVGIGRPPVKGAEVASWVLGGFAPETRAAVNESVATAVQAVAATVRSGPAAAMNQFNSSKKSI